MDFDLPEELKLLQQTIRDFVKRELIPLEGQVPEGEAVPEEIRTPIQEKIKEMGLWLIEVPEEYGGAGLSLLGKCIVWEEVGKTTAVPFRAIGDIFGPAARILVECNEQQREKYLFPLIRGEKKTSFALTEPEAGSDPASIQTRAVKRDSYYVINGAKRFITRGHEAHFFQVFAVTDPEKRARGGITCFLVDADLPGVELGSRYETMMGDRPSEIFFNDVKVPEENILGKLGEGFVLAQRWTTEGRLHQAARSLGTAQRCLDMAIEYANQRVTFGQPLARRQAVMFMIADSAMELHASRLIVYDCAWKHDQGREVRNETFMAKVYANEMASRVVDRAIQIHGSIGLTKELPLERWYRDLRSRRITEGASEVMRWTLARNLLRS